MKNIKDMYEYLKAIDCKGGTLFIAIKDDGVNTLNFGLLNLLRKIGVKSNLLVQGKNDIKSKKYFQNSFYSVLEQGKVVDEKISEGKLVSSGELLDGASYIIESCGQKTGEAKTSIQINGVEYAMNMRGMNIVVYDEEKHKVVDTVCFDTNSGLQCHRQAELK